MIRLTRLTIIRAMMEWVQAFIDIMTNGWPCKEIKETNMVAQRHQASRHSKPCKPCTHNVPVAHQTANCSIRQKLKAEFVLLRRIVQPQQTLVSLPRLKKLLSKPWRLTNRLKICERACLKCQIRARWQREMRNCDSLALVRLGTSGHKATWRRHLIRLQIQLSMLMRLVKSALVEWRARAKRLLIIFKRGTVVKAGNPSPGQILRLCLTWTRLTIQREKTPLETKNKLSFQRIRII